MALGVVFFTGLEPLTAGETLAGPPFTSLLCVCVCGSLSPLQPIRCASAGRLEGP